MAATSLALAAVAGTVALAVIEAIARMTTARANRGTALTTVAAVVASGGAALVVAAVATVDLGPSAGLLAAAASCVALLVALVVTDAGARRN
jgi:hypothetical protein